MKRPHECTNTELIEQVNYLANHTLCGVVTGDLEDCGVQTCAKAFLEALADDLKVRLAGSV